MKRLKELTARQREKKILLLDSLRVARDNQGVLRAASVDSAVCASLKREVHLQYSFMSLYQMLVLAMAFIVLILLCVGAWRVAAGQAYQAVIAGAGALVGGTAAAFLLAQRKDARDAYLAARKALQESNCP